MVALLKANVMNKEKEKHSSEISKINQASQSEYDHLNMHHHTGNAKEKEELSLPEKLIDSNKATFGKPSETIHEKVYSSNDGNNDDVC